MSDQVHARRARLLPLLATLALAGCAGVHMHRPEQAALAQNTKATFTDKVDLKSLAATERANLAKRRDADLAAVRQSLLVERDTVLFNAAGESQSKRLERLALPAEDGTCAVKAADLLARSYIERRACELGAPGLKNLQALALALGSPRDLDRAELVRNQREDLVGLGWKTVPAGCSADLPQDIPPGDLEAIAQKDRQVAQDTWKELVDNCGRLSRTRPATAFRQELQELAQLEALKKDLDAGAADTEKKISQAADSLKAIAAGERQQGETLATIQEKAGKLKEGIGKLKNAATKIGADDRLADERIEALTTLLSVAEGGEVSAAMLQDPDPKFRRAVVVAQTLPGIAGGLGDAWGAYKAPPRSSLVMAQQQAILDKERIAASKALIEKKRELVQRRMAAIAEEARLLNLAAQQAPCDKCGAAEVLEHTRLGYSYLSRSILDARAAQEVAKWEATYLDLEQGLLNDDYALKSWNNLIATPIVVLDGYHAGGIKPEALSDLWIKLGGLGLLGVAVDKAK